MKPEHELPPGARTVLVFGGTFDPPHRAHREQAVRAREAAGADHVLYIPAARSPHKADAPEASDEDRLAMLRALLRNCAHASVSTAELDRAAAAAGAPSFTIDTIRTLAREHPEVRWRLLIGADQAASFHRWRSAAELIQLAEPVVILRPPIDSPGALADALRDHWSPSDISRWLGRIAPVPVLEESATDLRARLHRAWCTGGLPGDDDQLEHELTPGVLRVIHSRGLYRALPGREGEPE